MCGSQKDTLKISIKTKHRRLSQDITYSLELWKATVLILHESPNERLRIGIWLSRNSCVWSYIATNISVFTHLSNTHSNKLYMRHTAVPSVTR